MLTLGLQTPQRGAALHRQPRKVPAFRARPARIVCQAPPGGAAAAPAQAETLVSPSGALPGLAPPKVQQR
jgi:hypothetical protein